MGKTLVTGAAGFIGMHVAAALAKRGDRVVAIDNFNDYYDPALKRDRAAHLAQSCAVAVQPVDFADEAMLRDALRDHDIARIVHLGAQPGVRHSIDNPHAYARSNLIGHLDILELARARSVDHLVYASSSSVYGASGNLPFRVEHRVDHPLSLYAATKKADEMMSESYAHLYRIAQTGLRFFTVYGPWGRPDMAAWLFVEAVLAGRPIRLFNNGEMSRDFTYIDDIVAGVLAALDKPPADDGARKAGGSIAPHRIWNIGNNRSERLIDFVAAVEAACGRAAIIDHQPMQLGDVPATFADISAIQAETGFAPRTPIAEGIPRFVDWYRAYKRI